MNSAVQLAPMLLHAPRRNKITLDCELCGAITREGKPYCSEHVHMQPYVEHLLSQLAAQEKEHERVLVKGTRAANLKSLTAKELKMHLHLFGPRTVNRLARELNLDSSVIAIYVKKMERAKVVSTSVTRRGHVMVVLNPISEAG